MTGFGSARAEGAGFAFEAEVRSVNHRHLKVHVRVPDSLTGLVPRLEERVRARLARGTVYLHLRIVGQPAGSGHRLNTDLLKRFYRELEVVAEELGATTPGLAEVAALPGVVQVEESGDEDDLWPVMQEAADLALAELEAMRAREGEGIAVDLRGVAALILEQAAAVEARAPEAVLDNAARLKLRVEQLMGQSSLEAGELAREVALLADKSDVSEEIQRLGSHVEQLRATLEAPKGPVGRKLEFMAQELHRESNTIGSKSHDAAIAASTLELKLLVERIREQVANLE